MLKRRWKQVFVFTNLINDLFVFIVSAQLCKLLAPSLLKNGSIGEIPIDFLSLFILIYILFSSVEGLYRGSYHISIARYTFGSFKTLLQTSLVIVTILVFTKYENLERGDLVLFILTSSILIFISKLLLKKLNSIMQNYGYGVQRSLVIDPEHFSETLMKRLIYNPYLGYDIIGFVGKSKNYKTDLNKYNLNELQTVLNSEKIETLFIPSTDLLLNGYQKLLKHTKDSNLNIKVLSPTSELLLKHSGIFDLVGVTFYDSSFDSKYSVIKKYLKRVFDIIGSSILLLILSPLFIVVSLLILVESGWPIIYKQKRASFKGGVVFEFIKFRSMVSDAEQLREEMDELNESDGVLFKMKKDPRITKLGKFIRKFSIDELPQLINVLKGEMSLVGPRPLPIIDMEKMNFSNEFWQAIKRRSNVKPGMTGLWQVYGRSNIKSNEMILLDLYYVENYSVLFDLEIIYQTIPVVVFGKGAW